MYSHRSAVNEDYKTISLFPQDARELFFVYPKGSYPLTAAKLQEVAQSRVNPLVVLDNGVIVGYGNLYDVSEDECWLGNVIIRPSYRGKGVGRYLIETMKAYAKSELSVKRFRLVCHNINTKALLFYTKLDFKPFDVKVMTDNEGNEMIGIKMEVRL
ncbi:Acetyltransferase (GNAT) family protein [Evansella caseinilytica]|uniref:Acetyltransferase (GNAT) family protein n=1 Tax=Evansella caseinilytica TaxID=1503961 RepID=A0A1H3Q9P1_9BACI|nr:GNAT family N-acetyltransferase [Evansella caseinilytica]SDZ10116.1 Acetyltransferase (GNAT) family protein [Evansella caseinilytica]